MEINKRINECGVCGKKRERYIDLRQAVCSVCGLEMCGECTYTIHYTEETKSFLKGGFEWEVFNTILATFNSEPPVVCNKCFSIRTREILLTYPIDDMGLLVNAAMIPLDLIKDRLSAG